MRGTIGLEKARPELEKALSDASTYVRIVAAETLGRYGDTADTAEAMEVLLALAPADVNGAYVSLFVLNALDELGAKAKPARAAIAAMKVVDEKAEERARTYGSGIVKKMLAAL